MYRKTLFLLLVSYQTHCQKVVTPPTQQPNAPVTATHQPKETESNQTQSPSTNPTVVPKPDETTNPNDKPHPQMAKGKENEEKPNSSFPLQDPQPHLMTHFNVPHVATHPKQPDTSMNSPVVPTAPATMSLSQIPAGLELPEDALHYPGVEALVTELYTPSNYNTIFGKH